MADAFTPNLELVLPEEGGSQDTWGLKLNLNFSALDTAIGELPEGADSLAEVLGGLAGSVEDLETAVEEKRDKDDTAFPRYDLASASTTATLNLANQQVFRVDATINRTLAFSNAPGVDRAMTVVVRLTGSSGTITWPAGIEWAEGTAPELRTSWTAVALLWDGATWRGFVSGGAD